MIYFYKVIKGEIKMIYAYVRVSTKGQDTTRQFDIIREYANKNNLKIEKYFEDKSTGKDFDRKEYLNLVNEVLVKGDTVIVTDLDRLGRNKKELKEQYQKITEKRGADLIIINQPFLSTGNKSKIERDLISGIVFDIFSWLAEEELEQKKERARTAIASMETKNGKKVSRKTGNYYGRPSIWEKLDKKKIIDCFKRGLTNKEIMEAYKIKENTFFKIKRELKEQNLI